jgi:hypothetical protein
VEGRTRRGAIAAGVAAGAAGVAVLATRGGDEAPRPTGRALSRGATARTTDRFGLGDVGIANFLLTVQRVEADVYARARPGSRLAEFGAQERRHVARLERMVRRLGGRTVRPPRTRIVSGAVLQYATTIEELATAACLGQLAAIDTPELLRLVLAIHTVDARHAATLAELGGLDPVPDGPLAQPLDPGTVLARLRPLVRHL